MWREHPNRFRTVKALQAAPVRAAQRRRQPPRAASRDWQAPRRTRGISSDIEFGGRMTLSASSWLRLEQGKQNHVSNRGLVSKQHRHPIDSNALPGCGGHSMLQRSNVVLVEVHGFRPTSLSRLELCQKAVLLVEWIIEL